MSARVGPPASLRRLARLYGVQAAYRDNAGQRQEASAESLLRALHALGAELESPGSAADAIRALRLERCRRLLDPVLVVWRGESARARLRLPGGSRAGVALSLALEGGERVEWAVARTELHSRHVRIEGEPRLLAEVDLPARLPDGYHRLSVRSGAEQASCLVIAAPARAYAASRRQRGWGAFLPLYALRTKRSSGVADFSELAELARWVGTLGGEVVGTLPLLATFLGEQPHDASPYAPVSRLFWNELFVDLHAAASLANSERGAALLAGRRFQRSAHSLRRLDLVDYRREAKLRREVLDRVAADFFAASLDHGASFRSYLRNKPEAEEYARFRAAVEKRGASWYEWPLAMQNGRIPAGQYEERARHTHLFAQYAAETQLRSLASEPGAARLYLDLPLGVHPDGYDVWRNRSLFARGMNAGAPPDAFFQGGQDWGFPPIVPEASRKKGHAYLIGALRNHFRYAGMLRLDHVMALYRLFWVPHGARAAEGVYVRYPADELFAIVALESRRHRCAVVGEDLGTVPYAVRRRMHERGVHYMAVAQFDAQPDPETAIPEPPARSVASLNTHDMPPFAAFWRGLDVDRRRAWGWLDERQARETAVSRRRLRSSIVAHLSARGHLDGRATPRAVCAALLDRLASSRARFLLVNLEDLWLETEPQNVPGTTDESPNWRRKARYPLEGIRRRVDAWLHDIDQRRRGHD